LENVSAARAWTIALEQYGQYYVSYIAKEKDWGDKEAEYAVVVRVNDEEKPTISFVEKPVTEIKLGESIVIPQVEVSDNLTAKENLTVLMQVLSSTGKQYLLKGGYDAFKPAYAGEYYVTISVMDEFGNMSILTYTVTVTK
jgi:hypothetical protein